ncbi:hypothetical protein GCM10009624_07940 [Gordonia sinesedis]
MAPPDDWKRALDRLSSDITKTSKRAGLPFRKISDLVNTQERYPELVPLLIDWLRNVEQKSGLTDARDLGNLRDGLARALTTIDATGTDAVPVLFDQFHTTPPMPEVNLYAVGNALEFLAGPADYDRMAAIGADRSHGSGRAEVLTWLMKQGLPEGLQIALDQLDDPSVRSQIIQDLRKVKPLPHGLRPRIEQYLDDPDSEVRKQAKATLKKLPE